MGALIDALNELQERDGYLCDAALVALAERMKLPLYRIEELTSFYPHFRRKPRKRVELSLCRDIVCRMACGATGAWSAHYDAIAEVCARQGDVELHPVSCLGRCEIAPAAAVNDAPIAAADIRAVARAIADPPAPGSTLSAARRWQVDPYPTDAERFGVLRARAAAPFDAGAILDTLKHSGLRGMGGAGFPTAAKWTMVKSQACGEKYVVCNADESEPGTFKDRVVLADLPHLVIEGMILAGLCVGAEHGIVFIRHEYAPERERLERAIHDARALGLLGDNLLGSGRRFELAVAVSPGGYILGEETALLECLQDKRGEPRNKPPFPVQHGLWGKPTVINNVETFALVPAILHSGADDWKARGVRGATGLKLIALSGDVEQPGVYEIAMGTTIAELIARAGGVKDGKRLYAIAPGGASSNFIAGELARLPLDFDALKQAGTMLGSGAVIAIAEGRDIVDLAANVVAFFRNESCGKCVPCRIGSEKAVQIIERAVAGRGSKQHLALLPELQRTMEQTSICGLGQVALNPFISVLGAFGAEVRARFSEP